MNDFKIEIAQLNQVYHMDAKLKFSTNYIERYEVRAKNHIFQLDCNRPQLLKENKVHIPWQWTLIGGSCPLWWQLEIQKALERHLRSR